MMDWMKNTTESGKIFKTLLICYVLVMLTLPKHLYGSECQISCFEDSCYMLQNQGPNWNDNRILCQKQGADIVSIETIKEWNFLNDLIQKPKWKYNKWMIGLEKEAGNWTWVSGKPLTICKWDKNQPSDDGDVAIIVKTSLNDSKVGLFQVTHGDQPYASICEITKDCFKDSCYVFMASGFTWMFNRDYCRNCGVDLISIETEEEWFFINGEIRNRDTAEWYIGLEKKEKNWTWVSERPLTIGKWRANQPSNNNRVAFIIRESDSGEQGLSTDPAGRDLKAFICEMPKAGPSLSSATVWPSESAKAVALLSPSISLGTSPSPSLSLFRLPSPSPSLSPLSSLLWPSPSLIIPSSSPSPSKSVQKLANEYVSKLRGLDSNKKTSLQEAVNVFENFIVSFENMTKLHEGQFTIDEFQKGRESIFNVAVAFEKFALNYGKHHLPIKIVSHKMVLEVQMAYRQNASEFYLDVHEWQTNVNIASSNFADNGSVVVGCVYKNLQDILPKSQPNRNGTGSTRYLGSRIIMAAMEPKPKKLLENVVLKFKNIKIEERVKNCMFWRGFSESFDGFSDEGCHVVTSRSNSEETVCSCNHLTHFAVLLDYNDGTKLSKQEETVLKIITYVGLSLSIIGILVTSALYFFFTDVRQPLSQIRLSLSVSLGVGQLIFLAGVNATEHTAACIAVAALMQYFLMAAFCWMLVEGIYLYLFVVKVYNINTKMHMYHVISWGFPMIMMAISLGIAAAKEGIQSYVSDKYCWLSSTNNLIWIFISFVTFIEVVNILILVRVIKEMTNLVQPTGEDDHIQQIRIGIKACALMIPLLGVTWLFGLLSAIQKAFAYIFTILNSTQGFLIFVLHGLRNSQIRERLKRKINVVFTTSNKEDSTRKSPQVNLSDVGDARAVELQPRSDVKPN